MLTLSQVTRGTIIADAHERRVFKDAASALAVLADLDPAFVAKDLVDDRFVRNAIAAVGGMKTFGLPEGFERNEEIGV